MNLVVRKRLLAIGVILALLAPGMSSPAAASHAMTNMPVVVAAADPSADCVRDVRPEVTSALLDQASIEVDRASALIGAPELIGERAYAEYLAELKLALRAWGEAIPSAAGDQGGVEHLLAQPAATAAALIELTTALRLASERLSASVDALPAWLAVTRAIGDGSRFTAVPDRFVSNVPVEVSDTAEQEMTLLVDASMYAALEV